MTWEYKYENLERDREQTLNKLGADGWELVAVLPTGVSGLVAVLKRSVSRAIS